MNATGRCLCGNIEYGLSQEPASLDVCHCKNCQRQAGASFIPFVAVPLSELSISGSPKTFLDTDTVSGNVPVTSAATAARQFTLWLRGVIPPMLPAVR